MVTNPARLDSDRAAMVCGHCHDQRLPSPRSRIRPMMSEGYPYDPGKDLHEFYKPVTTRRQGGGVQFCVAFLAERFAAPDRVRISGGDALQVLYRRKIRDRITCISGHSMHAPLLVETLQDNYPIVRYFAANALAAHRPFLPKPDYLATTEKRDAMLRQHWHPLWSPEALLAARATRERVKPLRLGTDVPA